VSSRRPRLDAKPARVPAVVERMLSKDPNSCWPDGRNPTIPCGSRRAWNESMYASRPRSYPKSPAPRNDSDTDLSQRSSPSTASSTLKRTWPNWSTRIGASIAAATRKRARSTRSTTTPARMRGTRRRTLRRETRGSMRKASTAAITSGARTPRATHTTKRTAASRRRPMSLRV